MGKRVISFFCLYILVSLLLTAWLMNVTFSEKFIHAGTTQGAYTLTVYSTRGHIYDRNMNVIAGGSSEYKAVVEPSAETTEYILKNFSSDDIQDFEDKLKGKKPYLISINDREITQKGITIVKCEKRYSDNNPIAANIVGYLDNEGNGVSGIEKTYNDVLNDYSGEYKVTYRVNALGQELKSEPIIRDTTDNSKGGVVLTIDSTIQIIAQRAAEEYLNSGAIVIMSPYSGEILACVSTPKFDQNNISKSLENENAPLINKAFSSYDVGSVFKLVVAAAAIENGYGNFIHCCNGYIDVGNKRFKCSSQSGHGVLNMEQATALSCNTFFIAVSQEIGYKILIEKAKLLGFGDKIELGTNYCTGKGNLPDNNELSLPAGLANFSFGQGSLLANPVQIAALVGCVANGGEYVYPYIVKETVNSEMKTVSQYNNHPSYRAINSDACNLLQSYMEAVMIYGTGKSVYSERVSTAAKTGSAETGVNKDGKQLTRGWFAGYFPADDPMFVCVVMEEDAVSGTASAGPCFRFLAERLTAIYGK